MASFVISEGSLQAINPAPIFSRPSLRIADDLTMDYAEIWRTQPAVRTVITFLARNIAQLGLPLFERVGDNDRRRVTDSPLSSLLSKPNPRTTRYAWINAMVHDLGIYDNTWWLKIRNLGTDQPTALLHLPARMVKPVGSSWLTPDAWRVTGSAGRWIDYPVDQVVHLHGYNPNDERMGCSALESLRRTLVEEFEAGRMREQVLRNGARVSGYLERPATVPWKPGQFDRFRAQWQGQYAGGGPEAGGTPILEDGMKFVPASQNSAELQYIEGRKLTREEVASAFFIPPPMVGILDHATFSNITEQHKNLYQDTLGPWLEQIQSELEMQLLPDFPGTGGQYVEFNLAEKLKGTPEEQAASLQSSVGAPIMTRNEGRARVNLPAIAGGDELVTPLNVLIGGQASPTDSAPKSGEVVVRLKQAGDVVRSVTARPDTDHVTAVTAGLAGFFARQGQAIVSRLGAQKATGLDLDASWDDDRWDRELKALLLEAGTLVATAAGGAALTAAGLSPDDYSEALTVGWLTAHADTVSKSINVATKSRLQAVLVDAATSTDGLAQVQATFDDAAKSRAEQSAKSVVTDMTGFGTTEGIAQSGRPARKTWHTGSNARSSHAALSGESVDLKSTFSNGARWPADSRLSSDERAGCNCTLTIDVEV